MPSVKSKTKAAPKCPGPGCENPAGTVGKNGCCSKRCASNYNAQQYRRSKGQKSREEAVADLELRPCPQCGTEFTPATFGQKYCSEACRDDAANEKRRTREKPFDKREVCLEMLDFVVVSNLTNDTEWESYPWISKEDYYKTDKRADRTKELIAEAQRFLGTNKFSMRYLFYHLVSIGMLTNSKEQYDSLTDHMTTARERGDLPPVRFTQRVGYSVCRIWDCLGGGVPQSGTDYGTTAALIMAFASALASCMVFFRVARRLFTSGFSA
jgi:hypothetical protein